MHINILLLTISIIIIFPLLHNVMSVNVNSLFLIPLATIRHPRGLHCHSRRPFEFPGDSNSPPFFPSRLPRRQSTRGGKRGETKRFPWGLPFLRVFRRV